MSQPQMIEQHQLIRRPEQPGFHDHTYLFMTPFLSSTTPTWSAHSILAPGRNEALHEYLISVAAQAYIVVTAFLHEDDNPEVRYTDMRLSHMIVDSFLAAGGQADGLRYLGINWIVNKAARNSMSKAIEDATPEQKSLVMVEGEWARAVTFTPSADSDNPFVRCAIRVAEGLSAASGKTIPVKSVCLVQEDGTRYAYHMVCEFEQPDCEMIDADEIPKKVGLIKRTFSKKGRDALRRTLSHIIRR